MNKIAGHKNIISILEYHFQKKHSHAFLFSGVESVGKTTVSDWFINQIFNNIDRNVLASNLLDIKCLEDKLIISIEQVIELQQKISLKPLNNLPIVVRIFGPENFSGEAANRLLKILEEPPAYVIFILITNNEQLVLPTIKSRCEVMRFSRVDNQAIKNYLLDTRGSLPTNIDQIISLAGGRPGVVMKFLENPEELDAYMHDLNKVLSMLDSNSNDKTAVIQDWFNTKKSYNERKQKMEYTLNLLQELLHAIIQVEQGEEVLLVSDLAKISEKLSKKQIIAIVDNLFKNKQKLAFNPDIQTMANALTL